MGQAGPGDHGRHDEDQHQGGGGEEEAGDSLAEGRPGVEGRLEEGGQGVDDEEPGARHHEAPDQAELHSPGELGLGEPTVGLFSTNTGAHLVSPAASALNTTQADQIRSE